MEEYGYALKEASNSQFGMQGFSFQSSGQTKMIENVKNIFSAKMYFDIYKSDLGKPIIDEIILEIDYFIEELEKDNFIKEVNKKDEIMDSKKIFIVHGHDQEMLDDVELFLRRLEPEKLDVTILKQKPDKGRTIIEKFEEESEGCGFALVLFSPDEKTKLNNDDKKNARYSLLRPHPNTIFELGYLRAMLGKERVVLLVKGKIDILSDYSGILHKKYEKVDLTWKQKVVKELQNVGFDVNL